MSVKIRVSFTDAHELDYLKKQLQSDIENCKVSREKKGDHYNAYITLKDADINENSTCNKPDTAI
ncbi:MAG: hypothetical protein LUI87_09455 [Lachnospiraceae bacterium]|nr:hypothetical protein [Lachnospiraceae bacterium]